MYKIYITIWQCVDAVETEANASIMTAREKIKR